MEETTSLCRSGESAMYAPSSSKSIFFGTPRFETKHVLGAGAMGIVYRAEDRELGIDIALKTLPASTPEQRYHLKHEFRILADLKHPNLVDLYELFISDDASFFTMELLEGTDFLSYTTSCAPMFSAEWQERLASILYQLAQGLGALHTAGRLHGDLKPENVLITRDHRVVLLDLGLSRALAKDPTLHELSGELSGTLAYLPGDEFYGEARTAASDWYSVGAMLYELVTGKPPFAFEEPGMMILRRGQEAPQPLREIYPHTPQWLDELTTKLLAPQPQHRGGNAETIAAAQSVSRTGSLDIGQTELSTGTFVGRQRELMTLQGALLRAQADKPIVARVHGVSGIGKSELIRHFVHRAAKHERALVLRGRCHPQESVPFKALDGVIDELSSYLLAQSEEASRGSLPQLPQLPHLGALLRVFPILRRLPELDQARPDEPSADALTLRRWAVEGLRELLRHIASKGPLIVWIDDVQWSDLDSVAMLKALLAAPHAPGLLLIFSHRAEDAQENPILQEFRADALGISPDDAFEIPVGPLQAAECMELARNLLPSADHARILAVAQSSMGSPFFAGELAREARPEGTDGTSPVESVVKRRLSRLNPKARQLLDVLSVAAAPLGTHLILKAAGLPAGARPLLTTLERACLARSTPRGASRVLGTYHDRIREAVLAGLSGEALTSCHRALLDALTAEPEPDPELLFTHAAGAGDRARTIEYAKLAATRAERALAFDRATTIHRKLLELIPAGQERVAVLERLAECLVVGGRGAEAPPYFFEAANARASEPAVARALLRQAAEQLVKTGRIEEGLAVFERVLAGVGVALPRTPAETTRRTAIAFGRLLLHRWQFRARRMEDIPPATLARLDALFSAYIGLTMMSPKIAAALGLEHCLVALDGGFPASIAHGLYYQAVLIAAIGGAFFRRRARSLLAQGDVIVEQHGDRTLRGFRDYAHGAVAWHLGDFAEAWRGCEEAIATYEAERRGTAWHRVAADNYGLSALGFLGEMRELSARRAEAQKRAEDTGDLFGAALFRIGQLAIVRLAEDEPLAAIQEADATPANFPLRDYHHMILTVQAELYGGHFQRARVRVEEALPKLHAERIFDLEFPRTEILHLRGRAWLSTLARTGVTTRAGAAELAEISSWSRRIAKSELLPARPYAASLRAGIAHLRGDSREAVRALADAVLGFEQARMALYAEAHRMALSLLTGRSFRALEESQDRMRMLGVLRPERMACMHVPWLDFDGLSAPSGLGRTEV